MTDKVETTRRTTAPWEDVAIFGVGCWLFLCPPTLGLHSSAVDMFGSVGAGVVTITLACVAMRKDRLWAEWTILAWGVVLLTLPWTLGFAIKAGIINVIACGTIAVALAAWRVIYLDMRRRRAAPTVSSEAGTAAKAGDDIRRAA